jgi:zinc protease
MAKRSAKALAALDVRAGAQIHESRLRNGLDVLIAERHDDPVVCVILYYGVGSVSETDAEAGMSHFLEHMMFKGSANYAKGEVDRLTTLLGGQNNAFTGKDHTAYWMRFASDRWETALEIEADRMRGLLLDPLEFDAERAVVLEELSMGLDDPWSMLMMHVEQALFGRHPYARPIIGYTESLRAMTPEAMRAYHARFYHPANAKLVIAGDVEPKQALRLVRKHFGKLEAGPTDAGAFALPMPPAGQATNRLSLSWDDQGRRLVMAWPTEPVGSDADYDLDMLSEILTGGKASRLVKRLVDDEGLATSVSTSNDTRVHGGAFWLMAECKSGIAPEVLEAVIDEELVRLTEERVPAVERKRVLARILSGDVQQGETVSELAEELGGMAIDLHWSRAFDGGVHHAKVTPKRLQATAKRLLAPETRVVGWSLPTAERTLRLGGQA